MAKKEQKIVYVYICANCEREYKYAKKGDAPRSSKCCGAILKSGGVRVQR